jgi:hypothetical protein
VSSLDFLLNYHYHCNLVLVFSKFMKNEIASLITCLYCIYLFSIYLWYIYHFLYIYDIFIIYYISMILSMI